MYKLIQTVLLSSVLLSFAGCRTFDGLMGRSEPWYKGPYQNDSSRRGRMRHCGFVGIGVGVIA